MFDGVAQFFHRALMVTACPGAGGKELVRRAIFMKSNIRQM
jgi:hypothetical protein